MFTKIKELKQQIIESTLTIGGEVADVVITKVNTIVDKYGPVFWELVAKNSGSDSETMDSIVTEEPEVIPTPAIKDQIPELEEVKEESISNDDIVSRLESISYKKLTTLFRRNQILKIIYIMMRSNQEWLSPKEISDFSESFQFPVLPGNIRKSLNSKGIPLSYINPQMRKGGRSNAKEYKVTKAGIDFLFDSLNK